MTNRILPILLMAVLAIPFAGMANADTSTNIKTDTFTSSGTKTITFSSVSDALSLIQVHKIPDIDTNNLDKRTVNVTVIYTTGYNPINTETIVTLSNDGKSVSHTFTDNDSKDYPRYLKVIDVRSLGVNPGDKLSVKVTTENIDSIVTNNDNTHVDTIATNNGNGNKEFKSTSDPIDNILVNNIGGGFSGSNDLRFSVSVNYNEGYNAENTETIITFPGNVEEPYTLTSDDKNSVDGLYTKLFYLSSSNVAENQVIVGTVTSTHDGTVVPENDGGTDTPTTPKPCGFSTSNQIQIDYGTLEAGQTEKKPIKFVADDSKQYPSSVTFSVGDWILEDNTVVVDKSKTSINGDAGDKLITINDVSAQQEYEFETTLEFVDTAAQHASIGKTITQTITLVPECR